MFMFHISDEIRKKIDTKAEKGILVGYEGDDGYRFFLQPGNRICRSRDVGFDEKVVAPTAGLDWPVKVNASPDECENGSIPEHLIIIIIIITAFVERHKVRRYRGAGGVRLRLSEKMGLEVSFEGVHSTAGSNVGW